MTTRATSEEIIDSETTTVYQISDYEDDQARTGLRFAPLFLVGVVLIGAGLRFYNLGSKGLWLDEAFSVWMGSRPIFEMFGWLLKIDQHPPLYYTLLHFWLTFGNSPATVRALSAILGIATIPIIYLIGARLGDKKMGLIAAVILALSPFHVRFAQETRMYALLTLNASLAILMVVRLLTDARAATNPIGSQLGRFLQIWREARASEPSSATEKAGYQQDFRESDTWLTAPTRRRWLPLHTIETDVTWLGYMVFSTATLLSHNTAVFFPVAVNLFVIGLILVRRRWPNLADKFQPPSLQNWLLAQLGLVFLWSPWLVAFAFQAMGVDREFWISAPSQETVFRTLQTFLSAFFPRRMDWVDVIWVLYALIGIMSIVYFRRRPARLMLLLTLFLTPVVGELLVSLRRPIFYDRTLIWITIPLYLLLAAGISQLRYRPYILVSILILATINGFSLREYFTDFDKEQWDDAARYVAENVENEDLILFNATWVQIPFDYYFRRFNRPVVEHGVPVDLFDRGILEPKMTEADVPRMQSLIREHDRIWLIYSHNWYTDPESIVARNLSEELQLLEKQNFFGLEVHLYGEN